MDIMHTNTTPTFSINLYDDEGTIHERGIYIHFGDTILRIGTTIRELEFLIDNLESIRNEITEYYHDQL